MKRIVFYLFICMTALIAFAGCQKGDGDADYGFGYVYMPQAMADGGLSNYYYVPSADSQEYTANFVATDSKVNVILGVMRSGKISADAFSVSVAVNAGASSEAAAALAGDVMPSDLYELPATVNVEAGHDFKDFYLALDKAKLASLAGKTLVLNVEIKNPTKYELAERGTSVTVVVDVDALLARI